MRAVSVLGACGLLLLLSGCTGVGPHPVPFGALPSAMTAVQADRVATVSAGVVSGRVTRAAGDPVVGLTITARARSATPACLRCGEVTTRTAQDGTFAFTLPLGEYFFTCTDPSGGLCRPVDGSPVDAVRVQGAETDVTLVLVPPRHAHPR